MPAWEERVRSELGRGNYEWLLTTPRIAPILASVGGSEIRAPGLPGLRLGCCGRGLVRVNGGGLYSEGEWAPNTSQLYRVETLRFAPPGEPSGCGATEQRVLSNPLGWPNYTPLVVDGLPECPEVEGLALSPSRLEPLTNTGASVSCRPEPAHTRPGLSPFRAHGSGNPRRRGGLSIVEAGGSTLVMLDATGGALALGERLVLESPYYEARVSILGPGTFFSVVGTRVEGEANAISISGPLGSIALASAGGMRFLVEPGRVTVEYDGTLRAARGGPLVAARLLHEDALVLRAGQSCSRGLGHLRVSGHVALVTYADTRRAVITVYSPVADGRGEARFYIPTRRATWKGLGDDPLDIPVAGDLVRWAAPFGSCGTVEVLFGGSLFLRLRSRKMEGAP